MQIYNQGKFIFKANLYLRQIYIWKKIIESKKNNTGHQHKRTGTTTRTTTETTTGTTKSLVRLCIDILICISSNALKDY